MRFDYTKIEEKALPHFKGGEKELNAKLFADDEGSSEIIFGLSGKGYIVCNGKKEDLEPGVACYCPEGSTHTVINDGTEDLTFFAVVPEHGK